MIALLLSLAVLLSAGDEVARSPWTVSARSAQHEGGHHRVWLGLQNNTGSPAAVCVASIASDPVATDGHGAGVLGSTIGPASGSTRPCASEQELHLLLPRQSYFVSYTISPPPPSNSQVMFRLDVFSAAATGPITPEAQSRFVVVGLWRVP